MPLLILWVIFAITKNYKENIQNHRKINYLLEQTKNTSIALNTIATLLTTQTKEQKSHYIMQQANNLISDINEILAEIIKRSNSISSTQMEDLMKRSINGERWLIAKTIIETNNFQSDFSSHILEKSRKDSLLKGSILEFNVHYLSLCELLEKYDSHKIIYDIIKYGALGKVHNILSPIIEPLSSLPKEQASTPAPASKETLPKTHNEESSNNVDFPSFLTSSSYTKPSPTQSQPIINKDSINIEEGLQAIKNELIKEEPTILAKPTPIITSFANTQSALRNLKSSKTTIISIDELEREINASPDNNFDENKTPFGDWLNEKKN